MKYLDMQFTAVSGKKNWYRAKNVSDNESESKATELLYRLEPNEHLICGRLPKEEEASLFLIRDVPLDQILITFSVGEHGDRDPESVASGILRIDEIVKTAIVIANPSACWLGFRKKVGNKEAKKIFAVMESIGDFDWYAQDDISSDEDIVEDIIEKQMVFYWWD